MASAPGELVFTPQAHRILIALPQHSPAIDYAKLREIHGEVAIFQALWSFRGVPIDGDRVMRFAGLSSGKPNDLFKVKARYKRDPEYEGPLFAYRALVKSNRREGAYAMSCANAAPSSLCQTT